MAAPLKAVGQTVEPAAKFAAAIVHITPDMAERWLGKNRVNRNIRSKRVTQMIRDMKSGDWRLTGEAIKFGRSGNLLDGQHRLRAIAESGCTVPILVVRGLEDDTQGVLDSGSARTAADNLAMAGHKNAAMVASIARRRITTTDFNNLTNSDVYEYVEQNPEIHVVAGFIAKYRASLRDIIPSTMGVAFWMIAEVNGFDVADTFFNAAAEKVGLAPGDPVLAMTEFFADQRRLRRRLPIDTQLSAIIRAFNMRAQGKPLRSIRLHNGKGELVGVPAVYKIGGGLL